nr:hypothetical protein GCM10025732_23560 [Glycomyces mayteni]
MDGLDLEVAAGQVHGFLGPNGSGKTTTLRALLGLIRVDGGTMRVFGQEVPHRLPEVVGRIGAVVESPQFFKHFSGRLTLQLLAESAGSRRSASRRSLSRWACATPRSRPSRATRWACASASRSRRRC